MNTEIEMQIKQLQRERDTKKCKLLKKIEYITKQKAKLIQAATKTATDRKIIEDNFALLDVILAQDPNLSMPENINFFDRLCKEFYDNNKKNKQIHLRLTDADLQDMMLYANKLNMSLSTYIRSRCLLGDITILHISDDDAKKILSSLAKIGNNLNQIAKTFNQNNDYESKYFSDVLKNTQKIIFEISEIMKSKKTNQKISDFRLERR